MLAVGNTVKLLPLLLIPATLTTTLPVVAPEGTLTAMLVPFHDVAVAMVPLNFTVLVPCVPPKLVPVMVTGADTAPDVTERLVMLGGTVKLIPLLDTPPITTVTGPVVAPTGTVTPTLVFAHEPYVIAEVPLKLTV